MVGTATRNENNGKVTYGMGADTAKIILDKNSPNHTAIRNSINEKIEKYKEAHNGAMPTKRDLAVMIHDSVHEVRGNYNKEIENIDFTNPRDSEKGGRILEKRDHRPDDGKFEVDKMGKGTLVCAEFAAYETEFLNEYGIEAHAVTVDISSDTSHVYVVADVGEGKPVAIETTVDNGQDPFVDPEKIKSKDNPTPKREKSGHYVVGYEIPSKLDKPGTQQPTPSTNTKIGEPEKKKVDDVIPPSQKKPEEAPAYKAPSSEEVQKSLVKNATDKVSIGQGYSSGDDKDKKSKVSNLQNGLINAGYISTNVDSSYKAKDEKDIKRDGKAVLIHKDDLGYNQGGLTKAAVKQFQQDHGIEPADGVATPETQAAIAVYSDPASKDLTPEQKKQKASDVAHGVKNGVDPEQAIEYANAKFKPEIKEPAAPEAKDPKAPPAPEAKDPKAPPAPEAKDPKDPKAPAAPEAKDPKDPKAPAAPEAKDPKVPPAPEAKDPKSPPAPEAKDPKDPKAPAAPVPENNTPKEPENNTPKAPAAPEAKSAYLRDPNNGSKTMQTDASKVPDSILMSFQENTLGQPKSDKIQPATAKAWGAYANELNRTNALNDRSVDMTSAENVAKAEFDKSKSSTASVSNNISDKALAAASAIGNKLQNSGLEMKTVHDSGSVAYTSGGVAASKGISNAV